AALHDALPISVVDLQLRTARIAGVDHEVLLVLVAGPPDPGDAVRVRGAGFRLEPVVDMQRAGRRLQACPDQPGLPEGLEDGVVDRTLAGRRGEAHVPE